VTITCPSKLLLFILRAIARLLTLRVEQPTGQHSVGDKGVVQPPMQHQLLLNFIVVLLRELAVLSLLFRPFLPLEQLLQSRLQDHTEVHLHFIFRRRLS
jgi:hypothetical protein